METQATTANTKYMTYMGKPFVRVKDTIYYGDPSDEFIMELKILDTKTVGGVEIANHVSVKLKAVEDMFTNRCVNKTEKLGLYNAMDVAIIWLQRKLKEAGK